MYAFVSHTVMFKLDFYPSLIIPQSANTGLSRTFFLQADKVGHFSFFVSVFLYFFFQNLKYPNLVHWRASWVNCTSKTHFQGLPTTYKVPLVQFSFDSEALIFGLIWGHPAILYPSASVRTGRGRGSIDSVLYQMLTRGRGLESRNVYGDVLYVLLLMLNSKTIWSKTLIL